MVDKTVSPIDFNLLEFGGRINLIRSEYRIALTVGYGIDKREGLINIIDGIRADSFDPYATIRSAYLQKRQTEIQN
jgi:phospholipid-binding lipoprotein MlaA